MVRTAKPTILVPVEVPVDENGHTEWKHASQSKILLCTHPPVDGIAAKNLYSQALTEALNALFREVLLPKEDKP